MNADIIPTHIACPNCGWPMTPAHDICADCETRNVPIRDEWHAAHVARTARSLLCS